MTAEPVEYETSKTKLVPVDDVCSSDLEQALGGVMRLSELQEVATGLGLEVELVAVVKERGNPRPSLAPPYQVLLEAITALGGRDVSTGEIARHVGEKPAKVCGAMVARTAAGMPMSARVRWPQRARPG